jgi:hypothetical protein
LEIGARRSFSRFLLKIMDANLSHDLIHMEATVPSVSNRIWIRLLFEDDHDFWRTLVAFLGSRRRFHSISQPLRFGFTVGVFLLLMGLVIQATDSPRGSGVRAQAEANTDALAVTSAPLGNMNPNAALSRSATQSANWQPLASSAENDQNFMLGLIDSISNATTALSNSDQAGSLAQNSTAANGSGGRTTSGFDGGARGAGTLSAAVTQQSVSVPEMTPTAILLGGTLIALLGLHLRFGQRAVART